MRPSPLPVVLLRPLRPRETAPPPIGDSRTPAYSTRRWLTPGADSASSPPRLRAEPSSAPYAPCSTQALQVGHNRRRTPCKRTVGPPRGASSSQQK
jgi:hypothetical protein